MKKKKTRLNIDWYTFDSQLEADIYKLIKEKNISNLNWLEELKGAKIIDARPPSYIIAPSIKLGKYSFRELSYTPDFIIELNKERIVVEVKSSRTSKKPDYRLRLKIFLSLLGKEIKFLELIQINTKKYEIRKYY